MKPERFTYPYSYTPHPWVRQAAEEVMQKVRKYMAEHPDSELHTRGKMFGVLVCEQADEIGYLCAFSAMLDGSYHHDGYVPPVVDLSREDGYFRQEERRISGMKGRIEQAGEVERKQLISERRQRSQALQRWLAAEYRMLNGYGEKRDLLELFRYERPILSEEDYYSSCRHAESTGETIPPSGTGECCLPKMLQVAYQEGMKPLCMAEFWMGASPRREIRREGQYYPSCQSKCRPILTHMLRGLIIDSNPLQRDGRELSKQVQIVYEDDWLMVVAKPSGLLSVPGKDGGYSLMDWAREHLGRDAQQVHRLDQDTSGLIVLAKTTEVQVALQQQLLRRDVHKRYEALLSAGPTADEGIIALPLLPNPLDRPCQMVNYEHGKAANTRYHVRERRADGTCLCDLFPETGRTHQLRVHAAHPDGLNAPIVGDRLYGGQSHPRLCLHAAELTLTHPITGETIHLISPSNF